MLAPLPLSAVHRIVQMALDEDAPWGDLTSQTLLPAISRVKASLIAREPGILSGTQLFAAAMQQVDPSITVRFDGQDGAPFRTGDLLATADGPARAVLQAERVALNLVQRLSGIATLTAKFVGAAAGTKARIVDTRKTTPGLRLLERYAVRCGGGHNHRYSLSDAMLVKDNHLAVLAAQGEIDLTSALRRARADLPHTAHLEVEVDRPDQIEAVLAGGADTILLDNFTLDQLRAAVGQIAGRALIEASGNVRLETVAAIAHTGVDLISAGALTHSVRSLDLGLDILPEA